MMRLGPTGQRGWLRAVTVDLRRARSYAVGDDLAYPAARSTG